MKLKEIIEDEVILLDSNSSKAVAFKIPEDFNILELSYRATRGTLIEYSTIIFYKAHELLYSSPKVANADDIGLSITTPNPSFTGLNAFELLLTLDNSDPKGSTFVYSISIK
jgi:hypothetical protein